MEDLASIMERKPQVKIRGGARTNDGVVKCPRHGQCFNIRTGDNIEGGSLKQQVYPVRLCNGDIEVEVEVIEAAGEAALGLTLPPALKTDTKTQSKVKCGSSCGLQ